MFSVNFTFFQKKVKRKKHKDWTPKYNTTVENGLFSKFINEYHYITAWGKILTFLKKSKLKKSKNIGGLKFFNRPKLTEHK